MANYTAGVLSAAKYKVDSRMNLAENKVKPSTALMKYLSNTGFLVSEAEQKRIDNIKESDQQTVTVHTLNKQASDSASARAAAHTGSINDDRSQTITFTTYAEKFKYSIKGADRNVWSLADQVAQQIISASINLHETIETAFLARLNTNKSQVVVSSTPRGGSWDATNYIFQVAQADFDHWMQKVRGFMRQQYYKGMLDAVVDETLYQEYERIINQGAGNSENLSWQRNLLDAGEMPTLELTLDASYDGQGYVFPKGTIGVLPWIPKLNRQGFQEENAGLAGGSYGTIADPLGSGLTFAVHQYQAGADNNSAAGETQDVDVEVEISIDLGPLEADTSTSNLTPIFKFGVLT